MYLVRDACGWPPMKSTKRAVITVRFTVVRCSNIAQSAPTRSSGMLGENATSTEGPKAVESVVARREAGGDGREVTLAVSETDRGATQAWRGDRAQQIDG